MKKLEGWCFLELGGTDISYINIIGFYFGEELRAFKLLARIWIEFTFNCLISFQVLGSDWVDFTSTRLARRITLLSLSRWYRCRDVQERCKVIGQKQNSNRTSTKKTKNRLGSFLLQQRPPVVVFPFMVLSYAVLSCRHQSKRLRDMFRAGPVRACERHGSHEAVGPSWLLSTAPSNEPTKQSRTVQEC